MFCFVFVFHFICVAFCTITTSKPNLTEIEHKYALVGLNSNIIGNILFDKFRKLWLDHKFPMRFGYSHSSDSKMVSAVGYIRYVEKRSFHCGLRKEEKVVCIVLHT